MLGLFVIPQMSDVIASSSSAVGTFATELYPLLIFLGVPIALTILGLVVYAVRKLVRGGASAVKGKKSRRGRGRRR